MPQEKLINIEVAFAEPNQAKVIALQVPVGTTIEQAIAFSQILALFPQINLQGENKVGIFGQLKSLDEMVQENDRIEIYRPILLDPKELRKKRQARQGTPLVKVRG